MLKLSCIHDEKKALLQCVLRRCVLINERVYEKLVRASLNVPQSASLWVLFPMSRKFLVVSSRNYPLETTQGLDAAKELQNERLWKLSTG